MLPYRSFFFLFSFLFLSWFLIFSNNCVWRNPPVFNLASITLLSLVAYLPWWAIRIWVTNSDDNVFECDASISMIYYEGACYEKYFSGLSTKNCISFTSTSDWNQIDAYLNGDNGLSSNTQSADMTKGATEYDNAGKLMYAGLAFCVISTALHFIALFSPNLVQKPLQITTSFLQLLVIILVLAGFILTNGNKNNINESKYWNLLVCGTGFNNSTIANTEVSIPLYSFFFAIAVLIFEFISISILLVPGNCCFCCPCLTCCGWCIVPPTEVNNQPTGLGEIALGTPVTIIDNNNAYAPVSTIPIENDKGVEVIQAVTLV